MKKWALTISTALATAQIAGCASYSEIPTGHFCYRETSNDTQVQYFACAFERNGASPYYDQSKIDAVVDRFIESKANRCSIYHRETMVDPALAMMDHAYRLAVVHIKCGRQVGS